MFKRWRTDDGFRSKTVFILGVALVVILSQTLRVLASEPATTPFRETWERPDRPVMEGQANRTWMWGPEAFTEAMTEQYAESPGGERTVQYFDKSRMEITVPDADQSASWYVTNGLLVVELMSGRTQVGNDQFVEAEPALVNVAGDADDSTGPTYMTFSLVADEPARGEGSVITERIDRSGNIVDDGSLAVRGVTSGRYVPETDHTVAGPFWSFMNAEGLIYRDGQYRTDALFPNPFYATGYPISEAYWAEVKVGGTYKDVLIQAFERRVLTYTPDNPEGWQVEAGNVGLHYYTWRYAQDGGKQPEPTPMPTEEPDPTPTDEPDPTPEPSPTPDPSPTPEPTPSPTPEPTPTEEPTPAVPSEYTLIDEWGRHSMPGSELDNPVGLAIGLNGEVYVSETGNDRIQVYNANGEWIRTFGEPGTGEGQFDDPRGLAVDATGNLYVTDFGNHRIQKLTPNGEFIKAWGGYGDADGKFLFPMDVAIDSTNGYVYVADMGNNRIQRFTLGGDFLTKTGVGHFDSPVGIDVDRYGFVYVVDRGNHRIQMFDAGLGYEGWFGAEGSGEGQFLYPGDVVFGSSESIVYVVDTGNHRIQMFNRAPTADDPGVHTFMAEWGGEGTGNGEFVRPNGIAYGGTLYVADNGNDRIQRFHSDGLYSSQWDDDSRGRIRRPVGLEAFPDNTYLIVVDNLLNQVKDWELEENKPDDIEGDFNDQWGSRVKGPFKLPSDAAYHELPSGGSYDLLYIADSGNNRIVRATQGYEYLNEWGSFGRGPGQFDYPVGIDTDEIGNVYVVDQGNHRVQKFNAGGDYLDEWGGLGSGPGQFNTPAGIAIYGDYVYVSDYENYRVQQFTLEGGFVRAWGEQGSGPGQFDKPGPVAVDGDGYVYVSDLNNHRVQKFTPDGDYYAEIGSGVEGFEYPTGLTVDPAGRVHVATASQIPRLWAFMPAME